MRPYEIPYRPIYEHHAAGVWVLSALAMFSATFLTSMPKTPVWFMGSACVGMALFRAHTAWGLWRERRGMSRGKISFINWPEFKTKANKNDSVFLGKGFSWGTEQVEKANEVLKRDPEKMFGRKALKNGHQWIHGLGMNKERNAYFPLSLADGHTLIGGTTGAGKTRLLDLLISQAILRGEAVVIIDPKGDKELRDNAKRVCASMGQPERFMFFNPAFPDTSVKINPLKNYNRPTEVASRIATLIASEAESDPFVAFSWMALNTIVNGLIEVGEDLTLLKIKRYLDGDPGPLLLKALRAHFANSKVENWETRVQKYLKQLRGRDTEAYMQFYLKEVVDESPSSTIDGLISFFTHNKEHASKMLASLTPIMNMLTSGALGSLLSPKETKETDEKGITTNSSRIIRKGQVAYIGLDSLSDSTIGSAIGSIFLADLTSVAGDRYNYGVGNRRVSIFIDESSEVLNKPTIAMLNKGRGCGLSLTLATQTLADFEARLGNKAAARQVLGNLNNMVILRVLDGETQEYISENMPKTKIRTLETQYRSGSSSDDVDDFTGAYGEAMKEDESPMFPPSLLGLLPNLHFLAKFSNGTMMKGRLPILQINDKDVGCRQDTGAEKPATEKLVVVDKESPAQDKTIVQEEGAEEKSYNDALNNDTDISSQQRPKPGNESLKSEPSEKEEKIEKTKENVA